MTKIFLDSGDPSETKQLTAVLSGQTTNPSLMAKNPDVSARIAASQKFTQESLLDAYKKVVQQISTLLPDGSVSIEVYADTHSTVDDLLHQAHEMNSWIPNAHIKLPITKVGLETAQQLIREGVRVNMTLCFSEEQAAAVYSATLGAAKGQVFLSPFIGRLDDVGENGMDLIKNCMQLFRTQGDGHVSVLAASIRSVAQMQEAERLQADIITAPKQIIEEWQKGEKIPYVAENKKPIVYKNLDLTQDWQIFDIEHPLTTKGIERFCADWNSLIK